MTNTEAQKVLGNMLMCHDLTDAELEAIGIAGEALENEAMTITEKAGAIAICPACGEETIVTINPPCFCILCGQRLKWEDEHPEEMPC